MLERFIEYIRENLLFLSSDKIILAVSGGADSITMLHLFYSAGIQAAVAHCNFRLRNEESDADEEFVRQKAKDYNMPFYSMHFNTIEYAKLQKISIQMAARELRYNWFENLRHLHGYNYIATAHNADDTIETFFINLLRGSGIHGFTGIKTHSGYIVRPLLFAFRKEIDEYCIKNKLTFRTDSSNNSEKYLRNKIRHSLLPKICEINPEFRTIIKENIDHLSDADKVYSKYITEEINNIREIKNDAVYISINKIKKNLIPKTLLFEILKEFGFSSKTSAEIYQNLDNETGNIYYTNEKRIVKDRTHLIVTDVETHKESKTYIDANISELLQPIHLKLQIIKAEGYIINNDQRIAAIDADKIIFPLILKKWHKGDYFQPLGMKGMKKISDFFIDIKLSIVDKEKVWILTSAGEIIWIVGMRLDDRYKITSNTQNILQVTLVDDSTK